MKYSKKQIEQYSIETKHIKHYIEKAIITNELNSLIELEEMAV